MGFRKKELENPVSITFTNYSISGNVTFDYVDSKYQDGTYVNSKTTPFTIKVILTTAPSENVTIDCTNGSVKFEPTEATATNDVTNDVITELHNCSITVISEDNN